MFGAVDAVAPGVGLVQFLARLVPALAQFAAAAHMGDREYAAEVEPGQHARLESRIDVQAIGAIGLQIERRGSVARHALLVDDRQRDMDPVAGGDQDLLALIERDVERRLGRDVGYRDGAPRVHETDHRRAHPAVQDEPAAVLQRVGIDAGDRPLEGKRDPGCLAARRQSRQASQTPLDRLDIDPVASRRDGLEHRLALRNHLSSLGEGAVAGGGLDHPEGRGVLVRHQIEIVAQDGDAGHRVGGRTDRPPRRPSSGGGVQWARIERDLVLHPADAQAQRHVAAGLGGHDREVDRLHHHGRVQAAVQHLAVGVQVGFQRVEPGDAVHIVVGIAVLGPGLQAVEEQAGTVRQPRGRAVLRAVDDIGQHGARRGLHDAQGRVFRARRRGPVGDIAAVRRDLEIVQRNVAAGRGEGVGIDQQPVGAVLAFADIELEGVGARRPRLGEDEGAGGLHRADRHHAAAIVADLAGQGVASGDLGQDGAGIGVLAHQIGRPFRIGGLGLHPAIGIRDGGPVQGLAHRTDRGLGRAGGVGRESRAAQRRTGSQGGRAGQQSTTVDAHDRSPSRVVTVKVILRLRQSAPP